MTDNDVRVLLVESSAGSAHLMQRALRELIGPEFELTWAGRLADALDHLVRGRFDVVLLDPALPDVPGPEAVRRLREAAPDVPLLLLASAADVGVCLLAMEQGAHDYLFKDVLTINLLARTIRDAVYRQSVTASASVRLTDPLTGLFNEEGLAAQAAQLWRAPLRLRKGATLLYLELDGLPGSSEAADRTLAETADVLRETFRGSDPRARLAGGEFAVLAVGAPEATAAILVGRLEEALAAHNAQPGRTYRLALALGLSHYDPERPCSFDDMLAAARARRGAQVLGRRETAPVGAAGR